MAYALKEKCKCDGDIIVMSFNTVDSSSMNNGKKFVDYGCCSSCFENVVLPNELYLPFVREFCRLVKD